MSVSFLPPPQYDVEDCLLSLMPYRSRLQLPVLEDFVIQILLCSSFVSLPALWDSKEMSGPSIFVTLKPRGTEGSFTLNLAARLHCCHQTTTLNPQTVEAVHLLPGPKVPSPTKQ